MLFGKHVERRGDTIDTRRHVVIPFDCRDRVNARAEITSEQPLGHSYEFILAVPPGLCNWIEIFT